MSVVYFDDEKFYKVNESLKAHWQDMAYLFGYPDGWQNLGPGNNRNPHIEKFTQLLRNANISAWGERYNDHEPWVNLDFEAPSMYRAYPSVFDLIKSLQSINYNMAEADPDHPMGFDGAADLLFKIIYHLMDGVIRTMKQYELSTAWE